MHTCDRSVAAMASARELGIACVTMRVAIVEGADARWTGEARADEVGLVLEDGREFWVGDDLVGMVIVEATDAELVLLAGVELPLEWLV